MVRVSETREMEIEGVCSGFSLWCAEKERERERGEEPPSSFGFYLVFFFFVKMD